MRNGFEMITLFFGTGLLIKVEQIYHTGQIIMCTLNVNIVSLSNSKFFAYLSFDKNPFLSVIVSIQ